MARWTPDTNIEKHEKIGRRLFSEPKLAGATDQNDFKGLLINNFQEKRDREISVDRMGRTGIDKKVKNYLILRGRASGKKFKPPKEFNGWAFVSAEKLKTAIEMENQEPAIPLLVASPIKDKDAPEDNIYHAHIVRPQGISPYIMALHLRNLVESHGDVIKVENDTVSQSRTRTIHFNGSAFRHILRFFWWVASKIVNKSDD